MALNLEIAGFTKYFQDKMFSAYEINTWKPDPALFLKVAKTMGCKPKDCAVVEDSNSGVRRGITGGFDMYAFSNSK